MVSADVRSSRLSLSRSHALTRSRAHGLAQQPWHLGWFSRYRPLPASHYATISETERPLITVRWDSIACEALGETVDGLDPLERLLRCGSSNAHEEMADCLWEAPSDEIAMEQLVDLSKKSILEFEAHERDGSGDRDGGRSEVEG